jgi:hypothetical protein
MRALAALAVAATTWSPPAAAQDSAGPLAAVDQLFEGMRTADADKVRSVLAPDARFAVLSQRDGPVMVVAQSVEGWVRSIGSSEGRWDEQVYDVQVSADGPMASVWAPYTFYLDGEISHCGINSIELLRDAEGWKITQISDTRRPAGCPDPRGI